MIKQFPREKGYPYLGHFINLNSTWEEQIHLLDETLITRLEAIDIEAINVMICSVLESNVFVARSKGGLGLRNPTNMYIARSILFMVEMLNSDDNQVRLVARESFQLHMNKRKVNLVKSDDPSFGGYEINEAGIIKKNSKQCLSKSQWVELNELCARAGIQLLRTDDKFKIVKPGTSQPLQCSNYCKSLYGHLHQKQLSEWTKLEFQGAT